MTENMKPSNLCDVTLPAGWECARFRKLFSFGKGLSITKEDLVDEGVPVISYGQVHSKANTGTAIHESLIRFVPESYLKTDKQALTQEGNFIFADTSEDLSGVGNCAFVNTPETLFAGYHSIIARPKDTNMYPKYFAYLFLTDIWRDQIRAKVMGVKVFSISQKLLRDTTVFIPPILEQKAIANLLDTKCAKIDSVIADIEEQIETLQKYKKSLITETVTKGCTAESKTKTVRLDFADEINEAWIETRVKYLCSMYSGDNLTSSDIEPEGDYPVYGGNGLRGFYAAYTNDGEHVLIGRQGALCGNVHLVSGKFWATDHAVVTYPYEGTCNGYLFYLFSAMNLNQYSQTAAQPGLAVAAIQNLSTCIPPTTEIQQEIAKYLDEKCGKIDSIIEEKRKQLEIMEEHKKSLIYEYVTGKKRVTEVN